MTRLLISVRNAKEAVAAWEGGADFIDVKEPKRGPLGRADPNIWRDIAKVIGSQAVLSAALGELNEDHSELELNALERYALAKVALSGEGGSSDWPERWRRLLGQFPSGTAPVAVIYADAAECNAPSSREILEIAQSLQCTAVLIDTFAKDGRNTLDHIKPGDLQVLVRQIKSLGMQSAVAGSLSACTAKQIIAEACPDIIAVRGAVCRGGRTGTVERSLVAALSSSLQDIG